MLRQVPSYAEGSILSPKENQRSSIVPTQKVGAETPIMAKTLIT